MTGYGVALAALSAGLLAWVYCLLHPERLQAKYIPVTVDIERQRK